METMNMDPEELRKALEKAQKDAKAMLEKMTPEEREQAEKRFGKLVEEDRASMQKLIDDAKKAASGLPAGSKPKFCPNCGAPSGEGKFCAYCGNQLQ